MIKFKEFNVGEMNYNEQIENFQKEHPSAEFVQITGGHVSPEQIWFKYESPEIIHPISPTREDPRQPVLDLIDRLQGEAGHASMGEVYATVYSAIDIHLMLNEIQYAVEDMEV